MSISIWPSIFSFAACYGLAAIVVRTKWFLFLYERPHRFESIDGLRGFLALAVFSHHFAITLHWKKSNVWQAPPEVAYRNYGSVGVALFFMITGFLFFLKLLKQRGNVGWCKLYESRIFRILPLYFFSIAIISIFAFGHFGYRVKSSLFRLIYEYLKWGLFIGDRINQFDDTRLVIAYVDWTLRYEWLFYFALPLLSFLMLRRGVYATSIIVIICILLFFYPVKFYRFTTEYFLLFALGGIAAWIESCSLLKKIQAGNFSLSVVASLLLCIGILYSGVYSSVPIIAGFFVFVLFVNGCDLFGLLRSKPAILLGELSYSIYLMHGIVLYAVFTYQSLIDLPHSNLTFCSFLMPIVGMLVVLVSCVTYLLIEAPFYKIGRKYRVSGVVGDLTMKAESAWRRICRSIRS